MSAKTIDRPICSYGNVNPIVTAATNGSASPFGGTSRVQFQIGSTGVIDFSVVFHNWSTASLADSSTGLGTISYGPVYVEIGTGTTQLVFNGRTTFTLDAGGYTVSDLTPISLSAGTSFYIRYYWTVAAGALYQTTQNTYFGSGGNNSNEAAPAGANIASSTGFTNLTGGLSSCPPAYCIGTPASTTYPPSVGIFGDNTFSGVGATNGYQSGAVLAARGANCNFLNLALPADTIANDSTAGKVSYRLFHAANCDMIVMSIGGNDVQAGTSAATIKANLLSWWSTLSLYNLPVWQSTLTPMSTGTFASASAQTPGTNDAVRLALNSWLRAPISAGAGNSALYDSLGTLTGIVDCAAYVETDVNNTAPSTTTPLTGGRWWCGAANNVARTADGINANSTGAGLIQNAVANMPFSSYTKTKGYAAASGFYVSLPPTSTIGSAKTGTIVLTGGNTLNSNLSVTISDADSTFTGMPVIITSGTLSATFTITPTTAGTKTLVVNSTGGNPNMSKSGATTMVASAASSGTSGKTTTVLRRF